MELDLTMTLAALASFFALVVAWIALPNGEVAAQQAPAVSQGATAPAH